MKMKRRLLYEGPNDPVTGTNVKGHTNFQNPLMSLAYNNNCWTEFGFQTVKDQAPVKGEAYYKYSTDPAVKDMPYMFLIPNPDNESFKLAYYDANGVEKESQAQVYCSALERTTNPVKTADQQKVVDFLYDYGFFEYESIKAKDMLQYTLVDIAKDPEVTETLMKNNPLLKKFITQDNRTFWMWKDKKLVSGLSADVEYKGQSAQDVVDYAKDNGYVFFNQIPKGEAYNYEKVDLSKPEAYIGVLSGLGDASSRFTGSYVMYRPKGVKTLRGDAKKYLEYYTKTLGWKVKDDMTPAEIGTGEWEWVDLSKPEQYSGNLYAYRENANIFPPGFIIGKKVDISMGSQGGGSLNEESCRQVILNYYDEMMGNQKQAPSLSDKRRVEACLKTFRGRYPKLKAQIDKLVVPPNSRASYRVQHGDYTTAPNLRTKLGMGKDVTIPTGEEKGSAVQQESRDRLLKNIISENLMRLKKKQLLERTLSSKNTYKY